MAATRLIALHKNKGKSVAACLKSLSLIHILHFLHVIMAILCQKKLTKKYWNLSANGVEMCIRDSCSTM